MTRYYCLSCQVDYPKTGLPHRCETCGGIFTVGDLEYLPQNYDKLALPGMWRYMSLFGLDEAATLFYLGEGSTPFVAMERDGRKLWFKCEHLNPSGSFKDRQSAVLLSLLRARAITEVLEDSSGNAGASLAQYARSADVKATIFIPSSSSGPKRQQIEASDADLVLVDGPRANAATAVLQRFIEKGTPYASHALLPFGLAAYATIAFEIYEELRKMPSRVFAPIGHGSLFLGLLMGFEAIEAYSGEKRPKLVGVQAENCSPVYQSWQDLPLLPAKPTIAEGVAVSEPVRGFEIVKRLIRGFDTVLAIKEDAIAYSHKTLARMGFYVESTAAMVWAAKEQLTKQEDLTEGDWVFILSGNGLKSIENRT